MNLANYQIQTKRLLIRPFTMEDADAFFAITRDPALFTYLPDKMPDLDEVRGLMRWLIAQYTNDSLDHCKYSFAVTLRDSGALIGWCGIGDLDFDPDKKELFYGYGTQYWGQGYGYEAAGAMVDTAFRILNLPLLTAVVKPQNTGSVRIIEKCGFICRHMVSGITGKYAWYNGERYYEMDRAQYDDTVSLRMPLQYEKKGK